MVLLAVRLCVLIQMATGVLQKVYITVISPTGCLYPSHQQNKTKPLPGLFLYQDTVQAVLIIISGSVDESVTVTVYTPAVGLASVAPDSPPTTTPSLRHT